MNEEKINNILVKLNDHFTPYDFLPSALVDNLLLGSEGQRVSLVFPDSTECSSRS